MPFFDLPLEQLYEYRPTRDEPADFDAFWSATLDGARQHPLNAQFTPVDVGLRLINAYDVTFSGYGGQPVKGWLLLPADARAALPCVVEYIGYGGGRGTPYHWLPYPAAGFALLVMDTRGQGSAWLHGDTPDLPDGANPAFPGFMTQGILDPHTYYYRRLYTDAVRAVEAAKTHPLVDAARVAVAGNSQGGGLSIAAAGLLGEAVAACLPDVPFLCHFRRAITLTDRAPYNEIARYLSIQRDKEAAVLNTLAYFDGMHLAARCTARCLYSVALMDMTCPPSTVFAAYNQVSAPKSLRVYTYNDHEGGAAHHTVEKIRFLHDLWGLVL